MTEKKRKNLIFAVLIVVSIWGVFNFMGRKNKELPPVTQQPTVVPPNSNCQPGLMSDGTIEKVPKSYLDSLRDRDWGKDPFYHNLTLNPQAKRHQEIVFKLMGITHGAQGSRVMINGKIFKVGDEIDGYTVNSIDRDFVELKKGQQNLLLRLTKESS